MNIIPFDLFLLLLLASIIALMGGLLFLYVRRLSEFLEKYGVSFAAGAMIITSLYGLLPEARHLIGPSGIVAFSIAFIFTYIFEKLLAKLHHHSDENDHEHKNDLRSSVPMIIIGDTIHNFIDGIAIATAYLINPGLALLTTLSTFFHEVPHEIGDFSILFKAGWKKRKIVLINVVSALSAILGGIFVYQFSISNTIQGYLLAITAGIFFYLGAVDFLPHAFLDGHGKNWKSSVKGLVPVLFGALVMLATLNLVPHSHDQHDGADGGDHEIHDEHGYEDGHEVENETHVLDDHDENGHEEDEHEEDGLENEGRDDDLHF